MVTIIVAIIGGLSSLIGIAVKGVIDAKADRRKADQERDKQYVDIISRLDKIEESTNRKISEITDELNNLRLELMELKDESRENDNKMKNTLMNLCKSTLNKDYNFFMNLGRIDENSLKTILDVHKCYKDFGGNTFIDDEIDKLRRLPVIIPYPNERTS